MTPKAPYVLAQHQQQQQQPINFNNRQVSSKLGRIQVQVQVLIRHRLASSGRWFLAVAVALEMVCKQW